MTVDGGLPRGTRSTLPPRLYLRTEAEALLWPPPPEAAYAEALPGEALRRHVDRLHQCREHVPVPVDEWIVPDGAVSVLFNLRDRPAPPGAVGAASEVSGPGLAPLQLRLAGDLESVGARLRVGAVPAVLGVPASELLEATIPLDELWGRSAVDEALDRLASAPHGPARLAVLEDLLRVRIADRARDRVSAEAVRRIAASGGRIRVRDLAVDLGVGERRLGQLFQVHVGLSPKETCRLARLRTTLGVARAEPDTSWAEVAFRGGYFDQAHLGNEVRRLTGLTPTTLRSVFSKTPLPPRG